MARAKVVRFGMKDMQVELIDGRTLNVPLAWFPKLLSAAADQRRRYALSEEGRVLSWDDLDLTISVSGLLLGPEGQSIVTRMPRPLSVEACRAALTALTREQAPHEWAKAQHDLGNALFRLDVRAGGGDPAPLEEAATAHREAVGAFDRARAPFEWAKGQYDFANALLALGARRRDTAIIKEAVAACHAAIEGYGEHAPIERAETQRLLGNALVALGGQETGTARFEEAVAVFRLALREHARGPFGRGADSSCLVPDPPRADLDDVDGECVGAREAGAQHVDCRIDFPPIGRRPWAGGQRSLPGKAAETSVFVPLPGPLKEANAPSVGIDRLVLDGDRQMRHAIHDHLARKGRQRFQCLALERPDGIRRFPGNETLRGVADLRPRRIAHCVSRSSARLRAVHRASVSAAARRTIGAIIRESVFIVRSLRSSFQGSPLSSSQTASPFGCVLGSSAEPNPAHDFGSTAAIRRAVKPRFAAQST
jgi:hypothetical protein